MYITRWLAGHPLIAIWVLGIIAILLTWPGLGGNKLQNKHSASETHHVEVQSSERQATDNDGQQDAEHNPKENNNQLMQAHVAIENPGSSALPVESRQLPQDIAPFKSEALKETIATEQPIIHSGVDKASVSKDTSVVSPVVDATTETSLSGSQTKSTAVQDLTAMSTEDMLVMAREAYWNNGLEEASEIYIKLIELEPDVLEHKGELGNVYWRQGFPEKAAELYSEVAIPMIKEGDGERVANMIGFIGLFFPDRAAEINRQLQSHRENVKK